MKADCPRAFKSCTIKLASRAPGQRGWSEMLQEAGAATREANAWVQPWSSQAGGSVEASEWAQHSLPWAAACPKAAPTALGLLWQGRAVAANGAEARGRHRCVLGSPYCHTVLPLGWAEAVCLQELLRAGHACSAVGFCTKPLSGIQGRSTLTCSNYSLLGMFFTATRLNHMQSLVISTPTWFSLTQDLFL